MKSNRNIDDKDSKSRTKSLEPYQAYHLQKKKIKWPGTRTITRKTNMMPK